MSVQKRLKLTQLGDFVNRHTVLTEPIWWRKTIKEVSVLMEQDADYGVLFEERIAGLTELRARWYEIVEGLGPQ